MTANKVISSLRCQNTNLEEMVLDKEETMQILEIWLREKNVINKPTAGNELNLDSHQS